MCGWNKDFGLLTDFEIQYMERLRRNGGCGGAGMMLTFFNDFFVIFRFCFFFCTKLLKLSNILVVYAYNVDKLKKVKKSLNYVEKKCITTFIEVPKIRKVTL